MRNIVNINHKWAFRKGAALPETFPAEWDIVNLPHSWNNIDGQDGGNDYWRGTGVYVQKLLRADLPEAEAYFLEINGANSSADVYLNGEKLAHHDGGYSTWRVNSPAPCRRKTCWSSRWTTPPTTVFIPSLPTSPSTAASTGM